MVVSKSINWNIKDISQPCQKQHLSRKKTNQEVKKMNEQNKWKQTRKIILYFVQKKIHSNMSQHIREYNFSSLNVFYTCGKPNYKAWATLFDDFFPAKAKTYWWEGKSVYLKANAFAIIWDFLLKIEIKKQIALN